MVKLCKHHGKTEFILEGRGYYRCKQCRNNAVSNRRRRIKLSIVEIHGGKCRRCGYNKCIAALQFHHKDKNKEFRLGNGNSYSMERAIEEASKCELLCANCHTEEHYL